MADVRPLRGLRYNPDLITDFSAVITPPYDVINSDQQDSYYKKNPHNIIRLEFGKELPQDNDQTNKYTRAAQTLDEWLQQGILIREERPAFYLTEHRYPYQSGHQSYWGLVASVRLENFETGQIRPTEIIMKGPATDRLNLLRACQANLSPIMCVYRQTEGSLLSLLPDIDLKKPSISGTDDFGLTFNVWVITDDETVSRISDFFASRPLYIADGHHRYTTALAYRDEQIAECSSTSSESASNFMMMTLISSEDTGLTLLPTHRLVKNIDSGLIAKLKERLNEHFHIRKLSPTCSTPSDNLLSWKKALNEAGEKGIAIGVYGIEGDSYLLLTPHDPTSLRDLLPAEKPEAWKELDVSLLHGIILQGMLGIDGPEKEKECVEYFSDETEILQRIDSGTAQLGLLLNPVPVSSVIAVAEADVRMPPKSTYFYPKTAAGLVINPLF